MIAMDDMLWRAAQLWWDAKGRKAAAGKSLTNLKHVDNPTIGCDTPEECALALAVAARLRLFWLDSP
jgi:hypothetical protein